MDRSSLEHSPRRATAMRTGLVLFVAAAMAIPAWAADRSADAEWVINKMIEAHGGMDAWVSAPTVTFVDEFRSGESESGMPSRVTVEQKSRRAYIDFPGTDMRMSWDGERAWSENWALPYPPRFLALLNYYFLNLPWLARDPGINLPKPETDPIFTEPTEYITVRMTFDAGVGDTPDDYYKIYVDPESYLLKATEYIVTYRSLLPEGVDSTPPHLLVFDEHTTVDGLVVPTHYTIYELDGSIYASCAVSDWSFNQPFDESRMKMPAGAVLDESTP